MNYGLYRETVTAVENNTAVINHINALKQRDFDDDTLKLLWSYLICWELFLNNHFSVFDLYKYEYAYCLGRLFGQASKNNFLETAGPEWDKLSDSSICLRDALAIEETYHRRGFHFLITDRRKTAWEKEHLNIQHRLKIQYRDKALEILGKPEKEPK